MNVTVIGTGHVGLVTCVTFSCIGHDVVGTGNLGSGLWHGGHEGVPRVLNDRDPARSTNCEQAGRAVGQRAG